MIITAQVRTGDKRDCPDCGQPQHYSYELGWAHDALTDTWHCNDPRKGVTVVHDCGNAAQCSCGA